MDEYLNNLENEPVRINPDTNDEGLKKMLEMSVEDFKHINVTVLTEKKYKEKSCKESNENIFEVEKI